MDRSLPLMAGTGEEGKKYHYHHYKTSTFFFIPLRSNKTGMRGIAVAMCKFLEFWLCLKSQTEKKPL